MNLIKEIDPGTADKINVIIEINKGSKNKYEIDKQTGLIMLDRAMHTTQDYPFDYGFVPQTLWDDGDPLDVLVLTTYPLFPGILVKVRPVAIVNMVDDGESDAKIIAVPVKDPRFDEIKDIGDINKHTLKEIEHFYKTYKDLQNKVVVINGIDGADKAKEAFEKALANYKKAGK
ncbi:MAG: inorganic pyrophosphatase [Parcubacteria group bacterium Gr01-1014_46]|nr:MAG: inorganic pyrophosphatase [Parcubacteria group bacterium Gr01-1014_46]